MNRMDEINAHVTLEEYWELMDSDQAKSKRGRKKQPIARPNGWKPRMQRAIIKMRPFGKSRPRVTQGGQHTYMLPKYVACKEELALLFGEVLVSIPLALDIVAIRSMPKSWSKKKRGDMDGRVCMTKPDKDNIEGAVMDALFPDDSGIVAGPTTKLWGKDDALYLTITEVDGTAVWEWDWFENVGVFDV